MKEILDVNYWDILMEDSKSLDVGFEEHHENLNMASKKKILWSKNTQKSSHHQFGGRNIFKKIKFSNKTIYQKDFR